MKKLYMLTIWAPGAIPVEEWKYRNIKRIMFPLIDFLFMLAGIKAIAYNVPGVSLFFDDPIIDLVAYILVLSAATCLVGVSFPRLWAVEIIGKSILLGVMSGYFASLVLLAFMGYSTIEFTLFMSAISICPVVWRLSLLGSEWQSRRTLKGVN